MAKYVSIGQLQGEIRKSFASLKKYMDENIRAPVVSIAQQAKALADEVVRRANAGEFKGDKGDKGDTGATGEQGIQGIPGRDGADGQDGADGHSPVVTATKSGTVTTIEVDDAAIATINDGAKGDTGATGATGAKGDKGDTGEKGEKGDKGDTGATGAQGAQGVPGAPGQDGADGVSPAVTITQTATGHTVKITDRDHPQGQSFNVSNGAPGENGAPGAKGDKGDKGDKGEDGADGKSIYAGSDVPATSGYNVGDLFVRLTDGRVFVLDDEPVLRWRDTGYPIKGAPGAKGDKGDKGDPGEDGADGEDGKPGWYYTKENLPDADPSFGFDIGEFTPTVPAPSAGNYLFWSRTSSVYKIQSISGRYAFVEENPLSLRGAQGIQGIQGVPGAAGAAGYSPVRGTDYWTAADIASIKSYVDSAILGGTW